MFALIALATAVACKYDLPIDKASDNPGVSGPVGVIQGTASYYGPGPCIRNGVVEGSLIVLVFDYNNPPPPAGLATTAVNFAAIPGELLFQGYPHPKTATDPGGGSTPFCPSIDSPAVTASVPFTVSQMLAGRYQVRAFYSRENHFRPLYDYANLPLAGDIGGGAVEDPRAANPKFIQVALGVPVDPKLPDGPLEIPDTGFVYTGLPVVVGDVIRSSRPYFYVDYAGSHGFDAPKAPVAGETKRSDGSTGIAYPYDNPQDGSNGIAFPQDHPITSLQNVQEGPGNSCLANPDPKCDLFKFAQGSIPQIHFRYGFPGSSVDPLAIPADAWIAAHAKPSDPFSGSPASRFYSIDPLVGETKESKQFVLTRNFLPNGDPAILVDNKALEDLAKIADLFPAVVLAKLKEDDDGNLIQPPQPQTDPIVIIQGFTLRGNTFKASSEGDITGGGLALDPANPLHTRGGEELVSDFTAAIRPAALCVKPANGDLRGTLVAPYELDPNPANTGDKQLVNGPRIKEVNSSRVKFIEYGCLPPGYYSVNVVYPTGQAWSLPNLMGTCSFSLQGAPVEDCYQPDSPLSSDIIKAGFPHRPFLSSQTVFKLDPKSQRPILGPDGKPLSQVVRVLPSARCMDTKTVAGHTILVSHDTHEDLNHDGILDAGEDTNHNGILDFAVPDICLSLRASGASCFDNSQCASKACNAGVCTPKALGAACKSDAECSTVSCDAQVCSKKRAGLGCDVDGDCASGHCTSGLCK